MPELAREKVYWYVSLILILTSPLALVRLVSTHLHLRQ
jgi:hypothetical protein